MGQKVSPVGLRIGINKDWEAKWFAGNKDFSKFLENDCKIRKFLFKKFKNAGVAQIVIERNSKRTEIFIHASKPGLIIGQSGVEIEKVKKEVSKLVNENIQISVVEIKNADLVAQLVADNIAHNIEDYDRIYTLGHQTGEFARVGLYLGAADKIRENIPEIELSGSFLDMPLQDAEFDGKAIQIKPVSADNGFFRIFGHEFIAGSSDVLDDKSNVIVSESFANANGGADAVIGKRIILRGNEFFVAAVLKEQKKSVFKDYDIVVNIDSQINSRLKRFKFYSTTVPFLKIREGVDIDNIRPKLEEEMKKIAEEGEFLKGPDCIIVNCKDLFFSKYGYMWFNKSDLKSLKIMLAIVLLLLVSAIFNFVNLSTALSTKRMKETYRCRQEEVVLRIYI